MHGALPARVDQLSLQNEALRSQARALALA